MHKENYLPTGLPSGGRWDEGAMPPALNGNGESSGSSLMCAQRQTRILGKVSFVAAALSLVLVACGGGGSSSGATSLGATSSGGTASAALEAGQAPGASATASVAPAAAACQALSSASPLVSASGSTSEADAELAASAALAAIRLHPLYEVGATHVGTLQAPTARNATGPFTAKDLRAMYQFAPVSVDTRLLTPEQRVQLGEGQTIYVVGAFHDPDLLSNLLHYSESYGLPPCQAVEMGSDTLLPLATAAPGCSISVVGADKRGNFAALPGFDKTWAFEESLDVQMAHAAAPLARIVVIAAQGDDVYSLIGAVGLANRMGKGIVSMSWGSVDQSVLARFDAAFQSPGMLYVSGSGDNGNAEGPLWPAAVPTVLSVGGTVASWDGSRRSEAAWSSGGGGMSTTRPLPEYQRGYNVASSSSCVAPSGRMQPDVSFAAASVYAYLPGWAGNGYYVVSGTSASAPAWAGILATANAVRVRAAKPEIVSVQEVLYGAVGQKSTSYSSGMYDVRAGSNGSCATCTATGGFDLATGLGTPNVGALLEFLRTH